MKKSVIAVMMIAGLCVVESANAAISMSRPMTISRPMTVSRPVSAPVSRPATVSNAAVHTNTASNVVTTMMLMNAMQNGTADQVEDGTNEDEVICDESVLPEECDESLE
ncbi:hypothetical protein OPFAMLBM_00314 [Aeromonas phage avDM12-TAAL]|nr:hypothetical protein OPFAMLBM_00314 [Aeromonas phage avDM12-TAAL]